MIGDVSGKGMPAAMTVSLLVGTFRTLAHYNENPGEILRAMNQRMLTRSDGGFTTCLVLRVDPGGRVTAANAGHLAPYLGGKEVPVDYGLPLGVAADSKCSESYFSLRPGEPRTLLTDGVPEARNAQGELFGFEKTAGSPRTPRRRLPRRSWLRPARRCDGGAAGDGGGADCQTGGIRGLDRAGARLEFNRRVYTRGGRFFSQRPHRSSRHSVDETDASLTPRARYSSISASNSRSHLHIAFLLTFKGAISRSHLQRFSERLRRFVI